MSPTTGSSATTADQRFPTHGTEASRAITDRTGRCDLGCQASAAAGEPRPDPPARPAEPLRRHWARGKAPFQVSLRTMLRGASLSTVASGTQGQAGT
jgi:hypothetical protein